MSVGGYRRYRRIRLAGKGLLATFLVTMGGLALYVRCAPFDDPAGQMAIPGTVVLDANGAVLQRDTAEGVRIPVELDRVAPIAIDATIAAEDRRFRKHPGIDPLAMTRAALTWRSNPSGASTITQQLARRLYLRDAGGPALLRKSREALIALQLEAHNSKDEILRLYLNEVYYGRGAYGIEAAARVYFDTSARDLDLAQAAMLAGLPQLPGAYDPVSDLATAKERQRYVLDRFVESGKITPGQADEAASRDLAFLPALTPPIAPHFVAFALGELARLRPGLTGRPGLVIETTLDAGAQREAERLARLRLDELKERNAGNAAVVAIEPSTGRILVMVGSADWQEKGGQINMATSPRQPGSALKPFLYAAAMERGYTAATPLLDVPITFETATGPYSPLNYDRRFHGVVPLRVALASSFNVPAVATLDQIGIDAFLEMAHRFGLSTLTDSERYGLALTLGGGEVRLTDLTAAYGALANGGELVEPFAVTRVRDTAGNVLYERAAAPARRVLSPELAFILGDIMSNPEARVPGFGYGSVLGTPFWSAVKTGTTTGFRDNWAIGFTPERVVGVWVGNTDNTPMRDVSGVDGAAPIWRDVLEVALAGTGESPPVPPGGVVREIVCSPTGLLPGQHCPSPVWEWFVAGTEPRSPESYYGRSASGDLTVNPPPPARAWATEAGLLVSSELAPGAETGSVQILSPAPGSVFVVAPELERQELTLKASFPPGAESTELRVNGAPVEATNGAVATALWAMVPGTYSVEAIAYLPGGGRAMAQTTFEVKAR